MNIYLTDEQYEKILEEAEEREGEKYIWLEIKHEPSKLILYCEGVVKDEKSTITYTEANSGKDCFWGDKETVEHFLEYSEQYKLSGEDDKCPRCFTPMIYKFNYCPKCGQILKWEEEK